MPDIFSPDTKKLPTAQPDSVLPSPAEVVPPKSLPLFAAFCHNPQGIQMKDQNPNESIILFLRRHNVTNFNWIVLSSILLVIPLVLFIVDKIVGGVLGVLPTRFTIIFVCFYYLIVIEYTFLKFTDWFYNVGIVTTSRIIDIKFTDNMNKEVSATRIADIIDVEFSQSGFLPSIYDYGDVYMQTEAEKENFEFLSIPHPAKVSDTILDLVDKSGGKRG